MKFTHCSSSTNKYNTIQYNTIQYNTIQALSLVLIFSFLFIGCKKSSTQYQEAPANHHLSLQGKKKSQSYTKRALGYIAAAMVLLGNSIHAEETLKIDSDPQELLGRRKAFDYKNLCSHQELYNTNTDYPLLNPEVFSHYFAEDMDMIRKWAEGDAVKSKQLKILQNQEEMYRDLTKQFQNEIKTVIKQKPTTEDDHKLLENSTKYHKKLLELSNRILYEKLVMRQKAKGVWKKSGRMYGKCGAIRELVKIIGPHKQSLNILLNDQQIIKTAKHTMIIKKQYKKTKEDNEERRLQNYKNAMGIEAELNHMTYKKGQYKKVRNELIETCMILNEQIRGCIKKASEIDLGFNGEMEALKLPIRLGYDVTNKKTKLDNKDINYAFNLEYRTIGGIEDAKKMRGIYIMLYNHMTNRIFNSTYGTEVYSEDEGTTYDSQYNSQVQIKTPYVEYGSDEHQITSKDTIFFTIQNQATISASHDRINKQLCEWIDQTKRSHIAKDSTTERASIFYPYDKETIKGRYAHHCVLRKTFKECLEWYNEYNNDLKKRGMETIPDEMEMQYIHWDVTALYKLIHQEKNKYINKMNTQADDFNELTAKQKFAIYHILSIFRADNETRAKNYEEAAGNNYLKSCFTFLTRIPLQKMLSAIDWDIVKEFLVTDSTKDLVFIYNQTNDINWNEDEHNYSKLTLENYFNKATEYFKGTKCDSALIDCLRISKNKLLLPSTTIETKTTEDTKNIVEIRSIKPTNLIKKKAEMNQEDFQKIIKRLNEQRIEFENFSNEWLKDNPEKTNP